MNSIDRLNIGFVVVSDRGYTKEREDLAEDALRKFLENRKGDLTYTKLIPDGIEPVREAILEFSKKDDLDLILTSGGTGVSPRDLTPEGSRSILDIEIPGIMERIRAFSFSITPNAILMRGYAGIVNGKMVVNLPGSPKSISESLSVVWDGLVHGIRKMKGDNEDCQK